MVHLLSLALVQKAQKCSLFGAHINSKYLYPLFIGKSVSYDAIRYGSLCLYEQWPLFVPPPNFYGENKMFTCRGYSVFLHPFLDILFESFLLLFNQFIA